MWGSVLPSPPPPRTGALLSRLRLEHDPDNGVLGRRVLVQEGDATWWCGRVTTFVRENNRQTMEGESGATAIEAILAAISRIGEAA